MTVSLSDHILLVCVILTVFALGDLCCVFQRDPPMMVTDLFEDIRDGVYLLSLLEVLSGETLVIVIGFPRV